MRSGYLSSSLNRQVEGSIPSASTNYVIPYQLFTGYTKFMDWPVFRQCDVKCDVNHSPRCGG